MCAFLGKTSRWCAALPQICSGVVLGITPGRVLCISIRDLCVPGKPSLLGYRQRVLHMSRVVQGWCMVRLLTAHPKGKLMPLQMIGVSLNGIFPQGVPAIAALMDNARRVEWLGFDALW